MINVCILGNGTVGSGVVELLNKNREYFKKRTGKEIRISKILVKDIAKHSEEKYFNLITNDINEIWNTDVDVVVEAMGGLYPAYNYIKGFLQKKKHVVTANKDVIAKFGGELSHIADINGVSLRFEASVAGGIPILKPLQECLAGNDIQCFYAILNGTTNFILSKMCKERMRYDRALKTAQELGFAEANPDSDVLGYDSARKLAILSAISYDKKVDWEEVYTEGITDIDEIDIACAKRAGYNIKLLAISTRQGEEIYAAVRPAFVPMWDRLGAVNDEFNGILLEGDAVGQMFFLGKGAGKLPTASAVLGDIFDVIENKRQKSLFIEESKAKLLSKWPKVSNWFIRVECEDKKALIACVKRSLNNLEYIDSGEESRGTAAFIIKAENESALDLPIDRLREIEGVKKIKKTIILDL